MAECQMKKGKPLTGETGIRRVEWKKSHTGGTSAPGETSYQIDTKNRTFASRALSRRSGKVALIGLWKVRGIRGWELIQQNLFEHFHHTYGGVPLL